MLVTIYSSTTIKCHFPFLMFAIITNNNLPPSHYINIYDDYLCRYKMATKHSQIRSIQLSIITMIGLIKSTTQALITVLNLLNLQYNLNLSETI